MITDLYIYILGNLDMVGSLTLFLALKVKISSQICNKTYGECLWNAVPCGQLPSLYIYLQECCKLNAQIKQSFHVVIYIRGIKRHSFPIILAIKGY